MADFVLREALATPERSLWFGETPTENHTTHDIPINYQYNGKKVRDTSEPVKSCGVCRAQ
jgi:hypothetical protein